jgi:fluoride exporter
MEKDKIRKGSDEVVKEYIAVGIGGALGAFLRYIMSSFFVMSYTGTIVVNILGSFILGLLTGIFIKSNTEKWVKVGLGTGFCGSFTTMSSFAGDVNFLLLNSSMFSSAIYLFTSIFFGIALAALGVLIGTVIVENNRAEVS